MEFQKFASCVTTPKQNMLAKTFERRGEATSFQSFVLPSNVFDVFGYVPAISLKFFDSKVFHSQNKMCF